MQVLVVCFANRCRSPMAAGLLRTHAERVGAPLEVSSAGFAEGGYPAEPEAVDAMAEVGIDLSDHRSREMDTEMVRAADLILVMTKQQVIDTVLLDSAGWPKTFTLFDAVRRARQIGPPSRSETGPEWVARLHGRRERRNVLGLPNAEDIADPIGQGLDEFILTRKQLDQLTADLATPLTRLVESSATPAR